MKTVVRIALVIAVGFVVTPSVFAGPMYEYYQDIPSPICGPVDPWSACYYPLGGGSGDCPARTSYDSCMKRCECIFNKNKEKCKQSATCISLAISERNACYGACLSDFA